MKAFILAGGFATRLWPLTEKRAKPLLPLAGKPLLTHLVEKIPEGIPITVSTNAVFAEDFEKWKSAIRDSQPAIRILIEDAGHEDEKLGALGAVSQWIQEESIDDNVLLLAGDNYIGFQMWKFLEAFTGKPLLAAHDINDHEKAKQFGIVMIDDKNRSRDSRVPASLTKVTGFQEKPTNPSSTLVSTGCYVLPADFLPILATFAKSHPDNIGGIFEYFLQEGMEVDCASFSEPWFDIGSFEAYLEATRELIGDRAQLEKDAVQENSKLRGSVVIGKESSVRNSILKDTVIFENCAIENCHVENCIIDNGCILKNVDLSGKMLREGTLLTKEEQY
jgi:glucose-1-phosphate thymidylyltransferase